MGLIITKIIIKRTSQNKFNSLTLNNLKTYCKVLSIYDGDTLTIGYRYLNKNFKSKIRMLGYDSPEMKPPKNDPDRDKEKAKAICAKNYLEQLTKDKILWVEFGDFDKYGRPLATLFIIDNKTCINKKTNINNLMIQEGHGYKYNGGTKIKFNSI